MKPNSVKQKLLAGGSAVGSMVFEFNTTGIARIAAEAGADFLIFDMEHTGWSVETIRMLLATSRSANLLPLVRIPATEYHFVARVLDVGAAGIMVPMVESGEQAQKIARSAKYPPVGRRGAAFGVAHDDYTAGDIGEKVRSANEHTLLIAQIETVDGLENVDAIASVAGIDVLWIGQYDLANSMGIAGQFEHPRLLEAIERVLAACHRHKKVPGFMANDVAHGKQLLAQGFRMLSYAGDLWIYQNALRQGIKELKAQSG